MARRGATLDPATVVKCGYIEAPRAEFRRETGTCFFT
jgi:hypothetical protein